MNRLEKLDKILENYKGRKYKEEPEIKRYILGLKLDIHYTKDALFHEFKDKEIAELRKMNALEAVNFMLTLPQKETLVFKEIFNYLHSCCKRYKGQDAFSINTNKGKIDCFYDESAKKIAYDNRKTVTITDYFQRGMHPENQDTMSCVMALINPTLV